MLSKCYKRRGGNQVIIFVGRSSNLKTLRTRSRNSRESCKRVHTTAGNGSLNKHHPCQSLDNLLYHLYFVSTLAFPSTSDIDKYVTGKLEDEQDNNQATAELAHFAKYKHIFQPKVCVIASCWCFCHQHSQITCPPRPPPLFLQYFYLCIMHYIVQAVGTFSLIASSPPTNTRTEVTLTLNPKP